MFQSLRWKIIGAFSLTILLTIILSGALSAWMTASRFDVFITSEGQYQAEEIAPLLEASYAISGNWDNLGELFAIYPETDLPPELFKSQWYSDIDWIEIILNELKLNEETLFNQWEQAQNLAAVAKAQGVDPDYLVQAIILAEEKALQEAIQNKEITAEEATDISNWVVENASSFVFEPAMSFDSGVPIEVTWTDDSIGWLLNTLLLSDERLLVADVDGFVVFDSDFSKEGEFLSDAMLEQGAWLWDYERDEPIGTVIVAAGEGFYNNQQQAFLSSVNRSLLISGFLAGAIALLVGLLFARKITSPVTALTAATHHIAEGHWDERLPVSSDDELGQMSAAFNAMAESLETQRSLRNRLVDNVTHELNTPLSVIQLELEALNDGMQTPAEATIHVKREISLLENLVSDLDLLTEFGEGRLQLDSHPTDFGVLAKEAVARWQAQAEARKIRLSLHLPDSLPEISVDARRIKQVLGNLISNALQHTAQGGEIKVSVALSESNSLITTVRDTGDGIASEDLPHIFERFYRADYARSRHTGGRGLGLAIVKEIIELHGGKVWVESERGEGSEFEFELPVSV